MGNLRNFPSLGMLQACMNSKEIKFTFSTGKMKAFKDDDDEEIYVEFSKKHESSFVPLKGPGFETLFVITTDGKVLKSAYISDEGTERPERGYKCVSVVKTGSDSEKWNSNKIETIGKEKMTAEVTGDFKLVFF